MPRTLAELPYAHRLEPLGDQLESGRDYDGAHLDDIAELTDPDARGCSFTESAFTRVRVVGGSFRFTRFADVWMNGVRWVGTNLGQTTWRDTELIDCAFSGVEAIGGELIRARFQGCKLDSINLRNTVLHDVEFIDCLLQDVDIAEANLRKVRFPGSTVLRLALNKAQLDDVDLRTVARLDIAAGLDALRGATISPLQLMDLAPAFAHAMGVNVRDT
jgi:uncharacterized protein YjbI with pentapeptide repeats